MTLMNFEMVFFNCCDIMDRVHSGWESGRELGWVLGVGGKLKVGHTIHKEADNSNVFSVELIIKL